MTNLFEAIGGRKMAITLVVLLLGTAIELFTSRGVSEGYVALLIGASTVFGISNAAVSIKGLSVGQQQASKEASEQGATVADETAIKLDYVGTALDQHNEAIVKLQEELETQAQALDTATKLIKAMLKVDTGNR